MKNDKWFYFAMLYIFTLIVTFAVFVVKNSNNEPIEPQPPHICTEFKEYNEPVYVGLTWRISHYEKVIRCVYCKREK